MRVVCAGYGCYELAIIAVRLTVQLVEHICHYNRALVWQLAYPAIRKGAQLIVGNSLQRSSCRVVARLEVRRGDVYQARTADSGVGEG
jgi:hypothetical protein